MRRVFAIAAIFLPALGATDCAHAASDIGLAPTSPYAVRMLPGDSGSVSFTVTNNGPDAVAPTIATNSIYLLFSGYTLSMGEPACGSLTGTSDLHSIVLPMLGAGASVACTLDVSRDTSPYAASDLPLYWFAQVPGDPDPTNDVVGFAIGSLIDISISVTPISFELDGSGIAHGVNRLVVTSHGPSAVGDFTVGACMDNFLPDFYIDGSIDGGCGDANWSPGCFDWGFGFRMPAMQSGDTYSCTIALTGRAAYTEPTSFGVYTADLANPDTSGGSLIDTNQADNHGNLLLEPDSIFGSGFDG